MCWVQTLVLLFSAELKMRATGAEASGFLWWTKWHCCHYKERVNLSLWRGKCPVTCHELHGLSDMEEEQGEDLWGKGARGAAEPHRRSFVPEGAALGAQQLLPEAVPAEELEADGDPAWSHVSQPQLAAGPGGHCLCAQMQKPGCGEHAVPMAWAVTEQLALPALLGWGPPGGRILQALLMGSHCRAVPFTGIDIEVELRWKSRGWITQIYSQDYPRFELLTRAEGVAEILTWAGSAVKCFWMLCVSQLPSGRCTLFLMKLLCTRNVNVIFSVKPRLNSKHFLHLFLDAFLSRI